MVLVTSHLINNDFFKDIKGIAGLIIAGKFTEVLQLKDFEEFRSVSNVQLLNDCVLRILSSNDFSISRYNKQQFIAIYK